MPACAEIFQRERSRAPLRCSRFDSGSRPFAAVGRRLGSRAHGRLWRYVARARPFGRIAPGRRLAVATPAALPRSHRRRLLPPLMARRLHSTPAPARRTCSLDNLDSLKRRWASGARSRCAARAFAECVACPRAYRSRSAMNPPPCSCVMIRIKSRISVPCCPLRIDSESSPGSQTRRSQRAAGRSRRPD